MSLRSMDQLGGPAHPLVPRDWCRHRAGGPRLQSDTQWDPDVADRGYHGPPSRRHTHGLQSDTKPSPRPREGFRSPVLLVAESCPCSPPACGSRVLRRLPAIGRRIFVGGSRTRNERGVISCRRDKFRSCRFRVNSPGTHLYASTLRGPGHHRHHHRLLRNLLLRNLRVSLPCVHPHGIQRDVEKGVGLIGSRLHHVVPGQCSSHGGNRSGWLLYGYRPNRPSEYAHSPFVPRLANLPCMDLSFLDESSQSSATRGRFFPAT